MFLQRLKNVIHPCGNNFCSCFDATVLHCIVLGLVWPVADGCQCQQTLEIADVALYITSQISIPMQ